jgi:2',3'-cyclic-nucleotide 2'-phosphodiesterase (5'-nucleotidase family)
MSSVRRREATGGNLIADGMHWLIETNIGTSATGPVLAMINGGFIRGDRQYSPGSDLTVRHILKELPFPRTMEVLEIRGAAMREAMRQQLQGSSKGPTGAFPHLSSNSKLEYVTSDDDDVSIITFKVNGFEVDDDQIYIIGVTSFVADGNEGCKSWLESVRVQNEAWNEVFISKVLLQYLSCHRNISPSIEGRVKRRQIPYRGKE